ncbi:MAG: type II toxin-antitoxin system PemK/MazF family toxin [Deltaproteobacteria bacterium]|nr:type II toxin-antitoxin system PemK/MazF family toxin [Deltaproteobacteria bacterium]MBI3295002.1 type II toxin-antitoxin system PemK/MazF family toxin [Deltaproteobacteria bacterium]
MNPGDILLLRFPFTALDTDRKRPSLLLHATRLTEKIQLVTIAMVTSKVDGLKLEGDVLIEDWKDAGLLHPSLIRLAKLATVERDLVEKKLGKVSDGDLLLIKKSFQKLYKFWSR